jgi:hypothetical protein
MKGGGQIFCCRGEAFAGLSMNIGMPCIANTLPLRVAANKVAEGLM